MADRKGFELSVGTLVVMILGIIIVGGGIVLLAKMTSWGVQSLPSLNAGQ